MGLSKSGAVSRSVERPKRPRAKIDFSFCKPVICAPPRAEFYNSLEAPALEKFPVLELFQEFLRANGALAALMSGSGSTTFALVNTRPRRKSWWRNSNGSLAQTCWTAVVAGLNGRTRSILPRDWTDFRRRPFSPRVACVVSQSAQLDSHSFPGQIPCGRRAKARSGPRALAPAPRFFAPFQFRLDQIEHDFQDNREIVSRPFADAAAPWSCCRCCGGHPGASRYSSPSPRSAPA